MRSIAGCLISQNHLVLSGLVLLESRDGARLLSPSHSSLWLVNNISASCSLLSVQCDDLLCVQHRIFATSHQHHQHMRIRVGQQCADKGPASWLEHLQHPLHSPRSSSSGDTGKLVDLQRNLRLMLLGLTLDSRGGGGGGWWPDNRIFVTRRHKRK